MRMRDMIRRLAEAQDSPTARSMFAGWAERVLGELEGALPTMEHWASTPEAAAAVKAMQACVKALERARAQGR